MNSIKWNKATSAMMLIAALCALFTGCSSSPSSGDGERAIQNRISEQSQGRIKLNKFNKSDAVQGEVMGVKFYSLEFDAEIEFTEDCKWVVGMFGQQLSFQTSKPVAKPGSGFSWNSFLDDTVSNPGTLVKKGQQVKLTGAIRFVKKEKGWSVEGVELKNADVGNIPQYAAGTTPSEQSQSARDQTQTESTRPPPAKADKEVLDALSEFERDYAITLSPSPKTGELASVFPSGGSPRIRFVESDFNQGRVKAVIEETRFDIASLKMETNMVTLSGRIDGGQLNLTGNDSDTAMALILQASYREISGRYKSDQSAGTVKVSFRNSYLRDADPNISNSLFWIGQVGKALGKKGNGVWAENDTQRFPASLSDAHFNSGELSGLRSHPYVYVAGMEFHLNQFPNDKRIMLFEKPRASMRVVPIYCMDTIVRKVSPDELEKLIKEQTGKSVAAIIADNVAAKEKAAALEQARPKTPQQQQANSFTIRGIKLGMTLSDIKDQLPNLQPSTNNTSTSSMASWRIERKQGLTDAEWMDFSLYEDRVYNIRIMYSLEDVDKLGGWQAVLKEFRDKLGEPDKESKGVVEENGKQTVNYEWKLQNSDKEFSFSFSEAKGYAFLMAENNRL